MNYNKKKMQKNCNCEKSQCLKKYCQCFLKGIICNKFCKCINCKNTDIKLHENFKNNLLKVIFCTCKQSKCLKKYCECFKYQKKCNNFCKCNNCENKDTLKFNNKPFNTLKLLVTENDVILNVTSNNNIKSPKKRKFTNNNLENVTPSKKPKNNIIIKPTPKKIILEKKSKEWFDECNYNDLEININQINWNNYT